MLQSWGWSGQAYNLASVLIAYMYSVQNTAINNWSWKRARNEAKSGLPIKLPE